MPNITIAIDEETLKAGREYVKKHNTSLNALLRRLLRQTITSSSHDWLKECFLAMDKAGGSSGGKRWRREDLYDV